MLRGRTQYTLSLHRQIEGISLEKNALAAIIPDKKTHRQDGKTPYAVSEDFEILFTNEDIADDGFSGYPAYVPVEQPPKGFMRLLYARAPVHTFNRTVNNAWLHTAMPDYLFL